MVSVVVVVARTTRALRVWRRSATKKGPRSLYASRLLHALVGQLVVSRRVRCRREVQEEEEEEGWWRAYFRLSS